MTEPNGPLGVAPGLLARLRSAGAQIEWRPPAGPGGPAGADVRIAHLFQEEARVERRERAGARVVRVDSGPVGALVLLLEADRHGVPGHLVSEAAGGDPSFPSGALVAAWGSNVSRGSGGGLRLSDLVDLARYALP